jgi:gliding motility-associated-like protein
MKPSSIVWLVVLVGFGALWPTVARATHVRAGEITTRRISLTSPTYEITLTAYFDEVGGKTAASLQNDVQYFCFGDGITEKVPRLLPIRSIGFGGKTSVNIYRVVHTYSGPGTYQIIALIENRNKGTNNIPGADGKAFSIRTMLTVNASLGLNASPVLTNPPLDSARTGQKFCHNPAAFDPDGDSLAYRMAVPLTGSPSLPCRQLDPGYIDPARGLDPAAQNEAVTGPATLTINAKTGDMCWDAPTIAGQYNIAFIVEEWRDGVLIAEITRDMQIIVTESRNKRPLIVAPTYKCVQAGTLINELITATDPDNNRVILTAFGGVFNRTPDGIQYNPPIIATPYASFTTVAQPQPQPATGVFRWQTDCAHIRTEEYDVVFKVNDVPPGTETTLVSNATFQIKVIGPSPKNLTAKPTADATGRAILLNWTPYTCVPPATATSVGSTSIVIYRRTGCSNLNLGECQTGLPTGSGYVEIGRVPATTSSFLDNKNLQRGVQYSYRILALYPLPAGGSSVISSEVCLGLPLQTPVLVNVTVDSTSQQRGQITVRWTRPIGLSPGDLTGPFQYRVFRATGLAGVDFVQIASINTNLTTAPDTIYVDRGSSATALNTEANAYRYRVDFFFTDPATRQFTRVDGTDPGSSPRLATLSAFRQIQLTWQTNTPWSNDNQRHRIYRSRSGVRGPFNIIAEVPVTSQPYRYTDTGADTFAADGITSLSLLNADSTYCYRVETVGRYTNGAPYPVDLLRNFSQITCANPSDTTKPCPPALLLDLLDCATLNDKSFCNQPSFTNRLNWTYPVKVNGTDCDQRIVSYKIYFNRYQNNDPFVPVGTVLAPTISFNHTNLTTVAGCYYVTAISRNGLESQPSNRVCKDICPLFKLPNVLTPNGDGKNDLFKPLDCPAFVLSAETIIVNRYGNTVFEGNDPNINWNGTTTNGQALPSGLYYYQVTVRFAGLDPNAPPLVLKGWVDLIREAGQNGG